MASRIARCSTPRLRPVRRCGHAVTESSGRKRGVVPAEMAVTGGIMQGIGWLAAIIVGGLAGWIASRIMKADTGFLLNVVLGIVGALVANFLLSLLGIFAPGTWLAQGLVGILGAVMLIWGWRRIRG